MFELILLTGNGEQYREMVKSIIVPAKSGEIGILKDHHPLVSELSMGSMKITKENDKEEIMFIKGGFIEVRDNKVYILADIAERIEEIESLQAAKARDDAKELLKTAKDAVEIEQLEEEIKMQMMREKLAGLARFKKDEKHRKI